MTLKEFDIAFSSYVQALTGRTVLLQNPNGPTIGKPFILITPSYQSIANDVEDITIDEDQLKSTVRGQALAEYVVQAFSKDAQDTLNKLKNSFQSSYFGDKLAVLGFGFSECTDVLDTSAPFLEADYEQRNQVTCRFYIASPTTFDIDSYKTTEVLVEEDSKTYSNTNIIDPSTQGDC